MMARPVLILANLSRADILYSVHPSLRASTLIARSITNIGTVKRIYAIIALLFLLFLMQS